MAEEEVSVVVLPVVEEVQIEEENETKTSTTTDLKRKLDDLEPQLEKQEDKDAAVAKSEVILNTDVEAVPDAKKPRLEEESDGSALDNGHETALKPDAPEEENTKMKDCVNAEEENPKNTNEGNAEAENLEIKSENIDTQDVKDVTVDNAQVDKVEAQSAEVVPEGDAPKSSDETIKTEDVQQLSGDLPESVPETKTISRKMEVPNNKVGVLIGKSGDTIRTLQVNSGAKIQIMRDTEADPHAATRPVELIGTLEHINKAEKLIKDVIAEADAGGSPSLVARGFGTVQDTGAADQIQIQVPIEKVGMIIGRGGETIKNLQTRSGARIQLIPPHLSEGDKLKERTVRVTGDKKQIEVARDMITEVMSQPNRPFHSSGYNQQGYRPRGSSGPPQWGARVPPSAQARGYDNQQRGMYPSQNPQYMAPAYGDYLPQQNAPRRNFNGGWDQRQGHMNTAPPRGYNDYYGHGGHGDPSAHAPLSNSGNAPAHGPPPSHVNYNNYGQPQGPEYGQPAYAQSAPPQQNYGHGNANQVTTQPAYGGQGNAQPGGYQQVATQPGYGQQPHSKPPAYGAPTQAPPTYGPPRPGQPGDLPYQNPTYGQAAPSQQPNPYASGGATQPYPYTSAPLANDGYSQQPQNYAAPVPTYGQPGGQAAPAYGQPVGQAAPVYPQQAGAYGPYSQPQPQPQPQPGYAEQQVPNNAGYGYQAPDPNYGTAPAVYGVQPTQPAYEQPAAQPGAYAAVPGNAPGYVKNLSPQPVYGQQYDAAQGYGGQH